MGTLLEVRLRTEVNSYSSRVGQAVSAVLIAPVTMGGDLLVAPGMEVAGRVVEVRRVGLGLVHETARLRIEFDRLRFPDGRGVAIRAKVIEVDNARERVGDDGAVKGIRATSTPGHRASGILTSLAAVDPVSLVFSRVAFTSVLNFSEPEIHLPAGAELMIRLTESVEVPAPGPDAGPPHLTVTPEARAALWSMVRSLPYRTRTAVRQEPSDITNVLLVGEAEAIDRAFRAAGWLEPEPLKGANRYDTLRAVAQTRFYAEAPMSLLLLEGREPARAYVKTLNTFARRHHLRIYETGMAWLGQSVYAAAATHDTGIALAVGRKPFDHRIDERIDYERAKVMNDLIFTGCVAALETVERPWVQTDPKKPLRTDQALAVLQINDCRAPRGWTDGAGPSSGPVTGNRIQRGFRQALLTARNDLVRGNFAFQGVSFTRQAIRFLAHRTTPVREAPERDMFLAPHPAAFVPQPPESALLETIVPVERGGGGRAQVSSVPFRPARVELTLHVGGLMFCRSSAGTEGVLFSRTPVSGGPRDQMAYTAGNHIDPGWAFGTAVTLHSTPRLAHELGLNFQRGSFDLELARLTEQGSGAIPGLEQQRTGLLTRQFSYATVVHFRSGGARVRPFLAAGPAFQLVHLTDAPFRRARGVFRLGLSNVGMIRAAYHFGSANPLEGGGIFQTGAQFGGGVKVRLTPRWLLRGEYRNTLSRRPDFLAKSLAQASTELDPALAASVEPLAAVPSRGRLGQHRVSLGFSFAF